MGLAESQGAPNTDGGALGRAGGVVYRLGREVDPAAVAQVYRSVGWVHMAEDERRLGESLLACTDVATAWEGDECVGVARLLSDRHFHGLILGVAVRPDLQGRGVGSALVQRLIDTDPSLSYHLWTRSRRFSFYARLGFRPDETAMERPRAARRPSGNAPGPSSRDREPR